jgi:glutathione peroxidase
MANSACHEFLDFSATKLRSSEAIDFCESFKGKSLLVVNTASRCGFTPQFKGLEALHQEYGDKLAVVGFLSDDFNQEYSDSSTVADVCYVNYGVTFTMLEPSRVRGDSANDLFRKLSERTGEQPSWNFNKYLVSADGKKVQHFSSSVKPASSTMRSAIDEILVSGN